MQMNAMDFSELPPGFGFHPTDVELISHYLKRKIMGVKDEFDMIPEVDIYKHEPWDLPAKSGIPSRECKWHFFNTRDRKYPNGLRSNRATGKGYWKSTGKDRIIQCRNRNVNVNIGTKKTLVFHKGRPPTGKRTDWIMHEYYLDDKECKSAATPKDTFVLCRITKRDGFPSAEEWFPPVEESNDSSTPPLHANTNPKETLEGSTDQLKMQKEESSSLTQVKDEIKDYEVWCQELYDDPDFPEFPRRMDAGSNLDFGSIMQIPPILGDEESLLSLEQQQQNFVLDGQNFKDSTCEWSGGFQAMEFQSTLLDPPEYETSSSMPQGWMESDEKMLGITTHEQQEGNDDMGGTGIVRRQREGRRQRMSGSAGTQEQKMRLQVHKMETCRKPAVSNHMVMLDDTTFNYQLDSDESLDRVCSPFGGQKECKYPTMIDNFMYGQEDIPADVIGIASSDEKPCIMQKERAILEEGCDAYSKYDMKDERSWRGVKRSMSGALKEARSLVRRCSSFGPSCLLVGTFLVGAAAVTSYFNEED